MDGQELTPWVACQFIRYINRHECVVRLTDTAAFVHLRLESPLDASRACLISALQPAPALVLLGQCENGVFSKSELDIQWPPPADMPPPCRYVRKPRVGLPVNKAKRRRVQGPN